MKGKITFGKVIAAIAGVMTKLRLRWHGQTQMNDPVLRDPYKHQRTHAGTTENRKGKRRYPRPACTPGTITYHDKLVRHFGRRYADKIGLLIRQGKLEFLPSAADFARTAK